MMSFVSLGLEQIVNCFVLIFLFSMLQFGGNKKKKRCRDIQHNGIQHNDIQHNDIQHNDIQHNDIKHNNIQHNDIQHNDIQY
jgi:hypothetical protein